jgi:hypothetical protein
VTLHVPATSSWSPLARLAHAGASRFAVRDAYVSAAMEALVRGARAGQAVHPDYLLKVADALLCHLEQWADATTAATDAGLVDVDRMVGRTPLRQLLEHIDTRLNHKLSLEERSKSSPHIAASDGRSSVSPSASRRAARRTST